MADDPDGYDRNGTKDTVPPPNGAKDAYSAQTRVGTLPEHVLEAMRRHESDALLEKRTKSGMQSAAVQARPRTLEQPASSPQPIAPPSSGVISAPMPAIHTPQDGWLSGAPGAPTPLPLPTPLSPSLQLTRPTPAPMPPTLMSARPRSMKPNVWRSVAIVAIFALLGALLAAFITRAGF